MALLTLRDIQLSFSHPPLLDGLAFNLERGERVCIIGRNGEGKSTLMKVIAEEQPIDDGERVLQKGAVIGRLEQEVPRHLSGRVFDVVAEGVGELAEVVKAYHEASEALAHSADDETFAKLEKAQQALEANDGWNLNSLIEQVISRMQLNPEADFSGLSGGMKRRVLLARVLVKQPDILLLDEPTNHLDVESIAWLEEFLKTWQGALIFITHDRSFLRALATRIVELDRGQLVDFPGDYDNYIRRREEMDNAEQLANARFDKMLAQEEVWIRQGIKARRTRNEGRVRRLKDMRDQFTQRRSRQGTANLQMNAADKSGKVVCEAVDVNYAWADKPIVQGLSTTIMRGDRIGIIGPNGCGKSTLLNLLLGKLKPDTGSIDLGTKLEIAYFDQLRDQLDLEKNVVDNVAEGSDKVLINGKSKHVISYLGDFLFPPQRCRQPVKALSGGERNRLLLAKLFTKPANVLVMDEPTNDLDLETLELLEELLLEFEGTLLLVSHDRQFVDNVVTSTLVFEGQGAVNEYVGGYADWLRQRGKSATDKSIAKAKTVPDKTAELKEPKKKLSYKDQRELDLLPQQIEALETERDAINAELADPEAFNQLGSDGMAEKTARLQQIETELEGCLERWMALDS